MIKTKKELNEFLLQDAKASDRKVKPNLFGDELWKFQILLRKKEYYSNMKGTKKYIYLPIQIINKMKYHKLSVKLNLSIPCNIIDKGLCLVHYGNIIISQGARIGENCRIQEGVTIGATDHSNKAAIIGDNVYIGTGAKIIGEIKIANNVQIGANAVVVKDILEDGTTWAGVPAKKISNKGSASNLSKGIIR